jgi:hypothetical protein
LKEAKKVIAIVEDQGGLKRVEIDPTNFVFLHHEKAQFAVAPLPERQILEAFKPGALTPCPSRQREEVRDGDQWPERSRLLQGSGVGCCGNGLST